MNASSAMAPLSPVIFSPSSLSRTPHRPPSPALMTSPKLWQKASISRLAEEFFWIGGSIVATPKWRIGQFVERCMCTMQAGTQMIKLRGKSKTLVRFFYLDEHRSCIRWRPSRKHDKAKISIDSIHEVCEGKKTEMFQHSHSSKFDSNCCFSIYHGNHVESLDLVTTNGEEARTWITGLKYLMAGISDEDSLARRQRTRDQWLRQTFSEADKNGDGNLSIGEVLQLLHKLNVNLPRQKVREMFEEADTDDNQGCLAFEEFCNFYKMISTRLELYLIMLTYSHRKEHMDINDLTRFLESEQKMVIVSREYCQMIINQFEPCPENRAQLVLGIDGFTNFMRSPAGDIFNPEHYQVNQDMTQPLTNYYIASSHNTYLTGDQLLSQSRVDMYAYVLQAGCRCVEVDCWDGPDGEPIIHHGYTLTSKILFRDVVETINKYAFAKSQYPVIISIENHCSVPQQKKMAQYLTEVLQDKLDLSSVNINESRRLPSPEVLKGKVLVKGKKLPANIDADAEEGDVSDEDSGEDEEEEEEETNEESQEGADGAEAGEETKKHSRRFMGSFRRKKKKRVKSKKRPILSDSDTDQEIPSGNPNKVINYGKRRKTMRLSRALSDLVKYTKSVRVHDIETQAYMSSWQVSSLNESITNQILQFKPAQLVRFNQRQLLRVYPSNYRVDSSNFNPQPFWNAGCHLVALNYQTEGRMLQLNRAKFAANGNCGYVLRPKCMCKGAFNPMLTDPLPGHRKTQLVLKIISGQQLPKPKDSMLGDRGEIIDPFVEVEIIGLPVDCNKEQTRVVDDNGFNPMWEETLVFTLHMPKIALVRFMVWDHDPIGRDFIGQRTIAFTSMMPGYRHVYLEGMEEASIFVHVAINDITGKNKSSNAVKQLIQKNLMQTSEDGTRTSFAPNFLKKSGAGKSRAKAKEVSQESYSREDFLNRRYSDDVNSQDSRTASQCQSLHRGAQSEPLKRSHRVCFQEPEERLGVTRSRLSSTDSCGESERTSNYINLGFNPRENPEINPTAQRDNSKLREKPELSPNQAKLSHQEDAISKASDLPPLVRKEDADSDPTHSLEPEIKVPAPQRPERPSLSKQCSVAENVFKDPEPECERYQPALDQEITSSSRHRAFKNVGLQGAHTSFKLQPISDQKPETCTEIWMPKSQSISVGHQKEWKSLKFDPKENRYPKHHSEQWTPSSPRLTTGKSGFGLRSSVDIQAKPANESLSIPATPARSRRVLHNRGSQSSTESPSKLHRSHSVPRRRPPSPPNAQQNFKTDVWKYPLPQNNISPVPQESSAPNLPNNHGLSESDSSSEGSLDSLDLSTLPCRLPENQQQTVGTLQREMNALFEQKMREIRCHSPLFFSGEF
ncbi:1-phosphatidylinositol 4,5-bisphosphate phosphodiesterase eta-2 [Colossoma macropomum]|uniref:1-phosphatidylinositol 4,5-bisphosphate phosphodiesterase eta-2 n=1 Tax=Colossoma macropomum TaxID=42526 RepID=UPI0018641A97|nr:1-phosphatidylinositol 4,5-bisphosphate phosphodiesterase eta-2 [Colossoma macropomum]